MFAVVAAWVALLSMLPAGVAPPATAQGSELPTTGLKVESLAAYDEVMTRILAQWQVPGGALAVMKGDRLVLARGYGLADRDAGEPVQPDSRFRIASLSKPITAVAILQLVEQGRLDLDAKALRVLEDLQPAEASVDPRIWEITVRQLLQHTAGWDRAETADPLFPPRSVEAAQALGAPQPASCETVIRYAFTQPLDFDPGTRFGYGNLNYCILGRIVERVTGTSLSRRTACRR
jgi:N-acyl-D-amino-acid deacylase